MRSVNIREARQKLSDLVDAAEHGQSVLITRHGKEVARIEPAGPARSAALPDLSTFRASVRAAVQGKGRPLSKAVTESRKEVRY